MASEINDALRVISDLGKTLEKAAKHYQDTVGDVSRLYDNTKRGADARNQKAQEANFEAVKKTTDALDALHNKATKWEAETAKYGKATKVATSSLKSYARNLKLNGPENMSDEFKDELDRIASATSLTTDEVEKFKSSLEEQLRLNQKTLKSEYVKLSQTNLVNKSLGKLRTSVFSLDKSLNRIKDGVVGSFDELEYAQARQIGTYGVLGQNLDSMSKEMSLVPKSFQQLIAENKASILASGQNYKDLEGAVGQAVSSFSQVNEQNKDLTTVALELTGNLDHAGKMMGKTIDTMTSMGDKLSFDEIRDGSFGLMKHFKQLSQISGRSSQEIGEMTNKLVNSQSVQHKLSTLNGKRERQQFLKRMNDDVMRNKKLGLSLEQSFQMAERMAGFGNTKAIERLKGAAVASQFASVLGMSKSDIGFIRDKGHLRNQKTPEDQAQLSDISINLKKAYDKALASNDTTMEVRLDSLMAQLSGNWQALLTAPGSISKGGKELDDKQLKSALSRESNLEKNTQVLADTKNFFTKTFSPWLNDPFVRIVGGGAQAGLSIIGSTAVTAIGAGMAAAAGTAIATGVTTFGALAMGTLGIVLNTAIPAAMLALAGWAGYEFGKAIAPLTTGLIKFFDKLTGWDVWGSIGGGMAWLLDKTGNETAKAARATMAASEASALEAKSLAATTNNMKQKAIADANGTTSIRLPKSSPSDIDARMTGMPRTDALMNTNFKRKASMRQLESTATMRGKEFTQFPSIPSATPSSTMTNDELAQQNLKLQEHNDLMRQLIAETKNTTSSVTKMDNKIDSRTTEKIEQEKQMQELTKSDAALSKFAGIH